MAKWQSVAEQSVGGWGAPGGQGHEYQFTLYERSGRWRITAREEWGSNQGYHEVHGSREAEGRGDNPEEAVEAVRRDVLAWADDDGVRRAELAAALRQLVYDAEDLAEEESD